MLVADSDVLIDFLKGYASARFEEALEDGIVVTTTVSRFEIIAGAITRQGLLSALELLEGIPHLEFDAAAADAAASVDQQLRAGGISLPTADTLIAGTALAAGLPLLTRNRKHFERVPGLQLEEI